jgi:hypothetical protein
MLRGLLNSFGEPSVSTLRCVFPILEFAEFPHQLQYAGKRYHWLPSGDALFAMISSPLEHL